MRPGARTAALAAAASLLWTAAAAAFPDGAPWDAAGAGGCAQCHFDAAPVEDSGALSIEGLPAAAEAGATYRLTVRLAAPLARAGFLLSARRCGRPTGAFAARDGTTEAGAAQVRSTLAGSEPAAAGAAGWTVDWTAPESPGGPITLEVWANAANDDGSPFGDEMHRRRWTVPLTKD